jgi:hypothetical protein
MDYWGLTGTLGLGLTWEKSFLKVNVKIILDNWSCQDNDPLRKAPQTQSSQC